MTKSVVAIVVMELVAWDLVLMPIGLSFMTCCDWCLKRFRKLALPVPCC